MSALASINNAIGENHHDKAQEGLPTASGGARPSAVGLRAWCRSGSSAVITAFLVLTACELVGEVVRDALDLPVPGPVIGMFFLAGILAARGDKAGRPFVPESLRLTAERLISHMGLLFVPAGAGVISEVGLLRKEWLPIAASLIGSTVISLAVTGLVMHWTVRQSPRTRTPSEAPSDESTLPL